MKKWTNRDWCWLVSILIMIIIIILTWKLNSNDNVVNIISMFASGASIVLAIVAIVQSTIYNNSSNELYTRMTEKLSILENNMEFVKDKFVNGTSEIIDKSPIDKDEKEELKRRVVETLKYTDVDIPLPSVSSVLSEESKRKSKMLSKKSVKNSKYIKELEYKFNKLIQILENNKDNKIRYRVDGKLNFEDGILKSYEIYDRINLNIVLKNNTIFNENINDISFSEYDDRIDVWIYGDKTNRFNIYYK